MDMLRASAGQRARHRRTGVSSSCANRPGLRAAELSAASDLIHSEAHAVRVRPLEAQSIEGHAHNEEERARIKHPDLSPQELALNPRVGDHLPKQRVDW